ncbi:SpoIIE family protein phosphatase [Sunxiuqinia sp. A32]|uniref:SpoIIE family protein phosphatase n=1 Tax=Sunxiuqinia sp. A32 TaxID=3461496 RepID=UPI0040463EE9
MKKHSIAFRLSLYVLLTVFVVIGIVNYLNYDFGKKVLMQNITEAATNQSGLIINQIARNVITTQEISKNVVSQAPYYYMHGDLDLFLEEVIKDNEILYAMHGEIEMPGYNHHSVSVIRKNNEAVLLKDTSELCLKNRFPDIVKNIIGKKAGEWSDPFYCEDDDNTLLISYIQSITNYEGRNIGALISEINLDFLNKIVSGIKIQESGFTFIVSKDGTYLTHPKKDWIMNRNIFEVSKKIFPNDPEFYRKKLEQEGSINGFAYPELLNYQKAWFYVTNIPYTDWLVFTVVPTKELFKDLTLVFRKIVTVSIVGLLIIFLIIILLFKQLLSPLMQVIRSLQQYGSGKKPHSNRRNELELLNESLEELQKQYSAYLKEQSQSRKDRRKYERDIKSAKEIQTTIVPESDPEFPESKRIDLYAELHPAESIGGDLYDYFFIDRKHFLFTIGDVSGKGIPAALFMAVAHTLIKSKATILSASNIVENVNKELSKQNNSQNFLTLFLGILDIESGVLSYCNAAHNYPFIIRDEKSAELLDKTHGLPVGLYPNKTYKGDSVVLNPGDSILIYTDGVIDCKDAQDQFYGTDRLAENVNNLTELYPKELVKRILKSLWLFKGETKQADDISLMAIRFLGKK